MCRLRLALLLLVVAWTGRPDIAWAASGETYVLPMVPKPKSGLSITFDCQGVDGNGYRPIRVTVAPLNGKAWPADRQIRIVILPYSYYHQTSPKVSQIIELPAGATSATATIAMPQLGAWDSIGIETHENGRLLRDLSADRLGWNTTNFWDWTEARPAILMVAAAVPPPATRQQQLAAFRAQGGADPNPTFDLPDYRNLVSLFPDPNRGGPAGVMSGGAKISDTALLAQAAELARFHLIPPAELPDRWIELSQYDVAVISRADLAALPPEKLRALADWAAGGPLLIVTGVGDDFAGLAEVEKLLALPRLQSHPAQGDQFRGWLPADKKEHRAGLRAHQDDIEAAVNYGPYYRRPRRSNPPTKMATSDDPPLPAPDKSPFAVRPIGVGKLVAIASDEPFPGEVNDWTWIFNCVPRNHWMWYERHGFSLHRENGDYWSFLIPGVGVAPVVSFLLLVSLFAVLIGPVNYLFLSRVKRLYLLLLTVPAGAAIVTGSLFFYALMTDGLGVKLRARSYTELDQRSGRAVAWSRQSYYAALAPSRGLTFPADATVFPIEDKPDRRGNGPKKLLVWEDADGQNLRSGYLASRTTTQYMVLRAAQSPAKLVVRASAQPPQVTNQLQAPIHYLLLRDSRGDYWFGDKIPPEAAVVLIATDLPSANSRLLKLHDENPLQPPDDKFNPAEASNISWIFPQGFGSNIDGSNSQPAMDASLLESNLSAATHPIRQPLEKGTYVAVLARSPIVPYGVPRVREEASLHVLRGRW